MFGRYILPQVILKRQGHGDVFAKIQALALTHPEKTVGELADALNDADFERQATQALIEKGICPIHLDTIHCPSCRFNPTHRKCEYNEIKEWSK